MNLFQNLWQKLLAVVHEPSTSQAKTDAINAMHKAVDSIATYAPEVSAIAAATGQGEIGIIASEAGSIAKLSQTVLDSHQALVTRATALENAVNAIKAISTPPAAPAPAPASPTTPTGT